MRDNVDIIQNGNIIQVERIVDRVVEVPVQDSRTKHLVTTLCTTFKRMVEKYPQLKK